MASYKEKPLGPYPDGDYDFFALVNGAMDWERTEEEKEARRQTIRQQHLIFSEENEDKLSNLISKITQKGVDVKKAMRQRGPEDIFVLESNPIDLSVIQGERRTTLMFLPDPKMKYKPKNLYELFFEELPESIYGSGPHTPKPEDIKNETNASIALNEDVRKFLKLSTPSGKEEFEEILSSPEKVLWVVMEISTDTGISYKISLPNPQGASDRYLHFSFPSRDTFTDKTMEVLLKLHRDSGKLNGEENAYAKSFAAAINIIREDLRVR